MSAHFAYRYVNPNSYTLFNSNKKTMKQKKRKYEEARLYVVRLSGKSELLSGSSAEITPSATLNPMGGPSSI